MRPNIKILILLVLALANQIALAGNGYEYVQGKECYAIKNLFEGRGSHCHPEFGYSCVYYNKIPKLEISSFADVASGKAFEDYIDEHKKYFLCDTIKEVNENSFFNLNPTIDVSKICVKTYVNGMENDSYQEFYFSTNKIGETPITKSGSDPCNNNWNSFHGGYRNSYDVTTILTYDVPVDIIGTNKREIYIDEGESLTMQLGEFYQTNSDERKIQFKVESFHDNVWYDLKSINSYEIKPKGEVEIGLEKICKDLKSQNDDYKDSTDLYVKNIICGKNIQFRAVKQLLDGTYTYGEIKQCKFFRSGADFEVCKAD